MAFNPKNHTITVKGKDYLPVAARLAWANDKAGTIDIKTSVMEGSFAEGYTVIRAHVTLNYWVTDADNGEASSITRQATAIKAERASNFPDFMEKAETGAIGRALAMLGFGTLNAELDEGLDLERLADAPAEKPRPSPQAKLTQDEAQRLDDQLATWGLNAVPFARKNGFMIKRLDELTRKQGTMLHELGKTHHRAEEKKSDAAA